ncbi:MAG: hypothetical protein HWD60_19290 [Defluviicoccus sp.]|nr:MAG: hypothetical protein HWD60_19290 [Defluviicoccus sp.]
MDEVCLELRLSDVSPWLRWNKREQSGAFGEPGDAQGVAGVFLVAWGSREDNLEVVYVGATGRSRVRLNRLESQVKWSQDYGFAALRDVLLCRETIAPCTRCGCG